MKIAFNLLPWREELEREARHTYIRQSVLSVILGGVLIGVGYFGMTLMVSSQNARNDRLVKANEVAAEKIKEITDLQGQIKVLNERKKVVESLQNARNQATRILEQMGVRLPEGVFLMGLKQSGGKVRLTGVALNQSLVATTMSTLDRSEWFSRPVLVEIKSVDAKTEAGITIKAQNFILDVQYTNPEEVTLQDVAPAPAIERQIRQKMLESELPPKPPSAPTRLEAEIPKAAATPASDASSPSSELAKPQRKADKAAKAKEAS